MNQKTEKTFENIINCGLSEYGNADSICSKLHKSQKVNNIHNFHIPEPWCGEIETAPILFVSLNPGYNHDEKYPMLGDPSWTTNGVFRQGVLEDFFEKRFSQKSPFHM